MGDGIKEMPASPSQIQEVLSVRAPWMWMSSKSGRISSKRREEGAAGAADVSNGGSDVVARVLKFCCRCGTVRGSRVTV